MKPISVLTLAGLLSVAAAASAQGTANDHAAHHPAPAASADATPLSDMTEAEVRKVDKAAAKITLKHGEIKNMEMPAMTMVFQVKNPAWLDLVQPGDKIRFTADRVNGAYTVLSLEPMK